MNAVRIGFGGAAVMPWAGCGGPAKPFLLERSQQKHTLSGQRCIDSMLIFLDTNIVQEDFLLRSGRFKVLLDYAQKTASHFVLPQIVHDELLANYARAVVDRDKAFSRAGELLNGVLLTKVDTPPPRSAEAAVASYRVHLLRTLGIGPKQIRPHNPDLLPEIMRRAVQRIPPCSDKGEEIRDALLWCTILDIAVREAQPVCFISRNTKEFSADKSTLHPALALEASEKSVVIEYFPSLEDFARKHATPIEFITAEWIEKQVYSDAIVDEVSDLILEAGKEAAHEREGRYSEVEGGFRVRSGGLSVGDFFVNRVTDGPLRVEATWYGEIGVSYEVRDAYDYHGSGYHGGYGPLSERVVEVDVTVTIQMLIVDGEVSEWSVLDAAARR